MDFYSLTLKKNCACKIKYGQTHYNFDEGIMSFVAPGQVLVQEGDLTPPASGWLLSFHPDFIRSYPLGQKIKGYGFFHYSMTEALILSSKEEVSIETIFTITGNEYHLPVDRFSQDVMVSQLDLLLTYCNRYYSRQFITRRSPASDVLTRMEALLTAHFNSDKIQEKGLPV